MSTSKGIFDSFPNPGTTAQSSPFALAPEPNPFAAPPRQASPFTVVDEPPAFPETADSANKPVKLPEKRKPAESPFQAADSKEDFGFEAAPAPFTASPFEAAPAPEAKAASPFAPAPQPASSPFTAEPAPAPNIPAATDWEPAQVVPVAASTPEPFAPAPVEAPVRAAENPQQSDSYAIRQLELRAIFGVDRELNTEEILQRSRALPGIRNIARVSSRDMSAVDSLKNLLPNLGFGTGTLKLYSGSMPLEFIREGSVLLAVQTEGGFAPGVRETLMIVARELGRMSA